MTKKRFLIGMFIIIIVITSTVVISFICNKKQVDNNNVVRQNDYQIIEHQNNSNEAEKIDIVDINSKNRPYAIIINNTPIAVKVQTGLNKAYLVYEIPTEGFTSRLMALYKDIPEDLTIGTIRSARHNFIDYALESDAILIHYGWSRFAEKDEKAGVIDYINGLFDTPFWRYNPENLPSEHTAYTSINKLKQTIQNKNYRTDLNDKNKITLLNYTDEEIDLSKAKESQVANQITIPYGEAPNITSFVYDKENNVYNRVENGNYCIDYNTKEKVNTKNIIVQKISYEPIKNSSYWNLETIGTGEGYFITNGYAIPITWKKDTRDGKTKYYYKNSENEIEVADGRTYIEIQTNTQKLTIE